MKALVKKFAKPGLWMDDIPVPEIGANDVLIKIQQTSICGTDIHIYKWDEWAQKTIPVPMTIGHEFMGHIETVGKEVNRLHVGQKVSGEGHLVCGFCRNCRAGSRHLCIHTVGTGVNRPGCFAEYLCMPARNVFVIPDGVSDDEACVLDPLGNAVHTALSFDVIGEDVLVTGAGPIGIMAATVANHAGARNTVITDLNEYRLALAKEMGVTHPVNIKKTKIDDVMKELGMTEGFDVGLEMSGSPLGFADMIRVSKNGAKLALLGILPNDTQIPWDQVIFKGLFLKGIYGREMFETWYKMCAMLQSGLNIDAIFTHRFPIDQFEEGFETMASGNSGKVILDWTK